MEMLGLSCIEMRTMCSFHRKYLTGSVYSALGLTYVILSVLFDLTSAYNIDLVTATVHSGETKSMFGFTVALHQDQGSKWYKHYILFL